MGLPARPRWLEPRLHGVSGTLIPAIQGGGVTKTSPLMTLVLSLWLPGLLYSLRPLSKPLSLPSPPHTHACTHAVLAERPGCSHCLPGYLLTQHLVGDAGISQPPRRLRNAPSCLTLPAQTLPVLFSAHCGQAPRVSGTQGGLARGRWAYPPVCGHAARPRRWHDGAGWTEVGLEWAGGLSCWAFCRTRTVCWADTGRLTPTRRLCRGVDGG